MRAEPTTGAAKVLVVDDDRSFLKSAVEGLKRAGVPAVAAVDAREAEELLRDPQVGVVVVDLELEGSSAEKLVKAWLKARPDLEVLVLAPAGSGELAHQAIREVAFDVLAKPLSRLDELLLKVQRASERRALKERGRHLEDSLLARSECDELMGASPSLRAVQRLVETVAPSPLPVLIHGEAGTGKSLVARALHARSPRHAAPLLSLSKEVLASLPPADGDAVLTAAIAAAEGGTLLIEGLDRMPTSLQQRLVRLVDLGERRRGASERVPPRLLAEMQFAPNSLEGRNRVLPELLERLSKVVLSLPPLRERMEDLPLLAQYLARRQAERMGRPAPTLAPAVVSALCAASWTRNVEGLADVMGRAVAQATGDRIELEALPKELRALAKPSSPDLDTLNLSELPYAEAKRRAMVAFERAYLATLLERSGNNVSSAARAAGVDRSNFRRLLKQYEVGGRSLQPEGTLGVEPPEPRRATA